MENWNNDDEERVLKNLVKKFEEWCAKKESYFLDLHEFEAIIQYYFEQENYSKAFKAVEQALALYPFSQQLRFSKVQILFHAQRYFEAIQLIQELEQSMPYEPNILLIKAGIYTTIGKYAESNEILLFIADDIEVKEKVYARIAYNAQALNKIDEAIFYYQKAIKLDIQCEEAHIGLIELAEKENRTEEVIAFYKEIIDQDPYQAWAWFYLSYIYMYQDEILKAIDAIEYAIAIEDKNHAFWFQKGHIFMNQAMYEQALECYEHTLALEDEKEEPEYRANLYCHIGACYEQMKNLKKAFHAYKEAMNIYPNWLHAWIGMGNINVAFNKWQAAIRDFKKAVSIDSNCALGWLGLAEAEAGMGNELAAEEAYRQAILIDPTNTTIWKRWALFYFKNEKFDLATKIIIEGIDEHPEEAEMYYYAVAFMIYDRNIAEALYYLEQALHLDYAKHEIIYNFFPDLNAQKSIFKIIEQFRKD